MNPDGRQVGPDRLAAIRPESAEYSAPSISLASLDTVTQVGYKTCRIQGRVSTPNAPIYCGQLCLFVNLCLL